MDATADQFHRVTGLTHNLEYTDDSVLETLKVDLNVVDPNEISQLMGSSTTDGEDLSQGVSLEQSIQMLLGQGYEIVDGDSAASLEADDNSNSNNSANNGDSQQPDIDPNGHNTVALELSQNGTTSKIIYKANGDVVYQQSTENEMPYSALGVTT